MSPQPLETRERWGLRGVRLWPRGIHLWDLQRLHRTVHVQGGLRWKEVTNYNDLDRSSNNNNDCSLDATNVLRTTGATPAWSASPVTATHRDPHHSSATTRRESVSVWTVNIHTLKCIYFGPSMFLLTVLPAEYLQYTYPCVHMFKALDRLFWFQTPDSTLDIEWLSYA